MGKVVHFEVPYDDRKRAKKFYEEIFGWNVFDSGVKDGVYDMVHTGPTNKEGMTKEAGFINGGMMKRMSVGEQPVIVIDVPNIDKALQKIEKMGGKIVMPKMEVMDMGLYARTTDTEGNIIGIWQDMMMKKTLSCRDLGVECDFVAKGKTAEEVKEKMMEHAAEAHKEIMEDMTDEKMKAMEKKMDEMMK